MNKQDKILMVQEQMDIVQGKIRANMGYSTDRSLALMSLYMQLSKLQDKWSRE